ncbi:glycoside hydrolase family 31 protein [Caproicibacter fermentans]|uniref:DUF5110 domain-containing protein n=1 Tax=Caproicibacter fermentans TaxID=2576756 RepID=A0A7G8T643_9FIRM|nr:TIM-barrel domain-containing protein [Caproicibacter fermentans]QNK39084.1 DUF5110 domain-containing protein [Caproicibacter fermentans]
MDSDRIEYKRTGGRVELRMNKTCGFVEVLTPEIVRVCVPERDVARESWAVTQKLKNSCGFETELKEGALLIRTDALTIKISNGFKVDFYDTAFNALCLDYRGERKPFERYSLDGSAGAEGIGVEENKPFYPVVCLKKLFPDEHFYGLGLTAGWLDKRGCRYEMWNTDEPSPHVEKMKSLYESVPFVLSVRHNNAYGIFFDNTHKSYFDMGKENDRYFYFAADGGDLNYYFISGPRASDVLKRYTFLTGRTPLPPLWSLGYQQSRWSYAPQEKLLEIAGEFRKRRIPCDVLYLDIDYMEGYRDFTWDQCRFPNPEKTLAEIKSMGFRVVTIVDPGVKKDESYEVFREGMKKGYFLKDGSGNPYVNKVWPGAAVFPDFSRGEVRRWWGAQQSRLTEMGVDGIWNDMDEPAVFEGIIPDGIRFGGSPGLIHKEAHNIYGSLMAEASYKGMKQSSGKRPFVITRACYAGVQKYSAVWTGDNQSMWEHLRMSLPMLMNLGVSGIAFCGADVGGFQYDCTPELLARWMQAAFLSPLFRNHSCSGTRSQEPWAFGAETETICRKYIELRYRFIPFLYDLFHAQLESGKPVIRPLFMEFQNDENVYDINDEFMAGDSVLAAPVVEQGKRARCVYLPHGQWYDFWTNEKISGGKHVIKEAPIDICPLYIRAGSVIPVWPVMQYTGEKPAVQCGFLIYPGNARYEHYEDDGESFDYEKGIYNIKKITVTYPNADANTLKIEVHPEKSNFENGSRYDELMIAGIRPGRVAVNGCRVRFERKEGLVCFTVPKGAHEIIVSGNETPCEVKKFETR